MSILFNKLKLLKKEHGSFDNESEKLVKNRNIYNFRRFVFSPVGSLLILTFIVIFGFLSFYSLFLLKGYISKKNTNSLVANVTKQNFSKKQITAKEKQLGDTSASSVDNTKIAIKNSEESPLDERVDIPDAPGEIIAGKPQPGKLFLPSQNAAPQTIQEVNQIAYLAPSSAPLSGKTLDQSDTPKHDSGSMADADSPITAPGGATADNSAQANTGIHHKTVKTPGSALAKEKNVLIDSAFDQNSQKIVSKKNQSSIKAVSSEEIRFQKARKLKSKRMDYTSKIAILTRQIEISLRQNDLKKADELINSFALTNNSNTGYFLKLKAFMDIKTGRLESASSLLHQVLKRNPDDLEAGINMAVVQVKRDNLALAKKRLLRLKESHPSNSRINALLNQF